MQRSARARRTTLTVAVTIGAVAVLGGLSACKSGGGSSTAPSSAVPTGLPTGLPSDLPTNAVPTGLPTDIPTDILPSGLLPSGT